MSDLIYLYFLVRVLSHFSCVLLFVTLRTVAGQAALSMEFSRQEYTSRMPCPPPEDLPNSGIKLRSPILQTGSLPSDPPGKPIYMKLKHFAIHLKQVHHCKSTILQFKRN